MKTLLVAAATVVGAGMLMGWGVAGGLLILGGGVTALYAAAFPSTSLERVFAVTILAVAVVTLAFLGSPPEPPTACPDDETCRAP